MDACMVRDKNSSQELTLLETHSKPHNTINKCIGKIRCNFPNILTNFLGLVVPELKIAPHFRNRLCLRNYQYGFELVTLRPSQRHLLSLIKH